MSPRNRQSIRISALLLALGAALIMPCKADSIPEQFKYPGAHPDTLELARKESMLKVDIEMTVYTTSDPFEKVSAYFKARRKSFDPKSGFSEVRYSTFGKGKETGFYLNDDPASTSTKFYMAVQYPIVRLIDRGLGKKPDYALSRKETAIYYYRQLPKKDCGCHKG